MEKTKNIKIPKSFYTIKSQKLIIPPTSPLNQEEVLPVFSDPSANYYLNLDTTNQIIGSIASGFFYKLNPKGKLIVNCPCSLKYVVTQNPNYIRCNFKAPKQDLFTCDNITFNFTDKKNSDFSFLCDEEQNYETRQFESKLKNLNITNCNNLSMTLTSSNIEKLNINCKNIYNLDLHCKNLKYLKLTGVDHLNCYRYWPKNIDFFAVNNFIPNNCIINLDCNTRIDANSKKLDFSAYKKDPLSFEVTAQHIDVPKWAKQLKDIKSFKLYPNKTFDISLQDLKKILKQAMLKTYDYANVVKDINTKIK